MRLEFDEGTLLLKNAPEMVPHAEWDDRVGEYRSQAYRYRSLLEWAGQWSDTDDQATLHDSLGDDITDIPYCTFKISSPDGTARPEFGLAVANST